MTPSDWTSIVERVGFPIAICLILLAGIGVFVWAAIRAFKPLGTRVVDAHTAYLDRTASAQEQTGTAVAKLCASHEQQGKTLSLHGEKIDAVHKDVLHIKGRLGGMGS